MKKVIILMLGLVLAIGCKSENKSGDETQVPATGMSKNATVQEFGAGVDATEILNTEKMTQNYTTMEVNDTLMTSFEATVTEVCQAKGCWMKLDLGGDRTAMVKFKDYGFFMPKDLAGKKVVVQGKAFVELMSVEDRKHYARDAGSSEEEIQAIDTPERTFAFEASGVRMK